MENTNALPKIIVAKKSMNEKEWNKNLPIPLIGGEKVIVSSNQANVSTGYVRVKHGKGDNKAESVFSRNHFLMLNGKEFSKC